MVWLRSLRSLVKTAREAFRPESDAAIDSRKRQVYLLLTPAGALFALADALQQRLYGTGNPFNIWTDVGLALSILIMAVLYWRGIASQRLFELTVFFITVFFILANFYFELNAPLVEYYVEGRIGQILKWAPWLEVAYLVSFLTFEPKESLALSILVCLGGLGIGIGYLVPQWLQGQARSGSYLLFQFAAASLITLVFLYQIGSLRQRHALTDFLTGIANRRHMYQHLGKELEKARRYQQALSIILCDLDHFKRVNDAFGHLSGDTVLKNTSEILAGGLRQADQFCRWGGEEFLVALPLTDGDGARRVADRLRETVAAHAFPRVGHVTASFGVATYRPGDTLEELLHRSDVALYEAKHSGRNRVAVEPAETQPALPSQD